MLPAQPTEKDLETLYTARGAAIVACEAKRRLAVETYAGEHADEAAWLRDLARNPFLPKRGN
ncbi:hypothetical protein GCM10017620_25920 [Brevundimonas intermedia]|uniref:Uncharacterized protein n=1 Tax=Brevundimonas intermedia TaxID=74315 RepID=A0ABQ5TC25_9CAUL|nr:hypothetical protein [Brevundimonas intermedia]GLK49619.1 hypothetical protein GCM10017620_25920 [Brevundimonas intermedia]